MANELNHKPYVMSAEEFADVKSTIKSLWTKLFFMKDLTDDNTASFNKISDGDKVFIGDCLTEAEEAILKKMVPLYTDVDKIRLSDLSHDQLWVIEDALTELLAHVRRNRMLAADDAYSGVSSMYSSIKQAAKDKVQGAVAMFGRLQSYHMKRVQASKDAKAAKQKAEEEKAKAVAEAIAIEQAKAAVAIAEEQAKAAAQSGK
jgi:4-aminobutyrate aminotransferase-like enzyme